MALLSGSLLLPAAASGQGNPADLAGPGRRTAQQARKALRELGIVAERAGRIACADGERHLLVNFIRRGRAPDLDTRVYGVDLCSGRPFTYREPTHPGVITGFDTDPLRLYWADDPRDTRNLRGDRFGAELLAGLELLVGNSRVDFGDQVDRVLDVGVAPSLGVRIGKVRLSGAWSGYENTWLAKVSVAPFRRGPPAAPDFAARVPEGIRREPQFHAPVGELCNAERIGVRGVEWLRIDERDEDGRYPLRLRMVSYCSEGHPAYDVTTRTSRTFFHEFNNTYPKFADWGEIPRGNLLQNLSVTVGYGQLENDVNSLAFQTRVLYVGAGLAFGDSRWRVDLGRLIAFDDYRVPGLQIDADAWTVQVQRALHLEWIGL